MFVEAFLMIEDPAIPKGAKVISIQSTQLSRCWGHNFVAGEPMVNKQLLISTTV